MTPTWIVWSPTPPECREKVSCASFIDAARAWAERQFKKGMLARSGTEVLVRCENDPIPHTRPHTAHVSSPVVTATTYQVKISIVSAPAFRASLVGVVYDGNNGDTSKETQHG